MEYAVSLNGKLYIISVNTNEDVVEQLSNKLKNALGIEVEVGSYLKIAGFEYESNSLSNQNPEKRKIYFDQSGRKYEFFNKDIIYI